jgi:hypothetical protein
MSLAINVGANTNQPGFRGPIWADGSFEYIPIPESEPTAASVPTYGDLASHLTQPIPTEIHDQPVHLDPEFPEYPFCERYTYGDEHGVKAGPLSSLSSGEYVFFYATLTVGETAQWLPPDWGAFVIGHLRLARDPVTGEEYADLPAEECRVFENNAHVKRETNDARVLLLGDSEESRLYEQAVPLSTSAGGTEPNWLVTACSEDSGKGPWWRRPLGFDTDGTGQLLEMTAVDPSVVESYQI